MRKIAIYGKGGIGKSTVCSNLSAAFALQGLTVMQIGCDPKADSTLHLTDGKPPIPVIEYLRKNTVCNHIGEITKIGFNDVICIESGGPPPGIGCAGRGILSTFEVIEDLGAFETYKPDIVMFDVLGDVVCGGFTTPIRDGWAEEVYIVTSGEKMSLFAAKNIAKALDSLSGRGYARLAGVIGNCRGIPGEKEIIKDFARTTRSEVTGIIPRDNEISFWESQDKTVLEGNRDSEISRAFIDLAGAISRVRVE